jgi:integrase
VPGSGEGPRIILPLDQWPAADRELLEDCCGGSGPLGDANRAAGWSPPRQKIITDSYGRYLAWLAATGGLDLVERPADRITKPKVLAFIDHMRLHGLSPVSIGMAAGALSGIAQAMAPTRDWAWLKRRYGRLKLLAKPRRSKRQLVVPSAELYGLGIHLMETAYDGTRANQPFFAASQFRDGLLIALLAARPLRIRNFQDIELGRTLVYQGERYWLVFDEDETKTGRPIEVYVPAHLTPYLETYLKVHRLRLLQARPPKTVPTAGLWVSRSGAKMKEPAIRTNIKGRTMAALGRPIFPHLFRDCLATSFAIDDPEHIHCVMPILGHSTIATSEKHYNQATSLTAARSLSATMLQIRYAFIDILHDEGTRAFLEQITSNAEGSKGEGGAE